MLLQLKLKTIKTAVIQFPSYVSTQPGGMDVLVFVDGKTVGKHPLFFRFFQHTTLFGKDGMWTVENHFYHCVCILNFNNHDHLIEKFGSFGCENSQFHYPVWWSGI